MKHGTAISARRRDRRQVAEINVVPYIDVMLVLLVIFMITAPLLRTGVEIDLPDADAKPVQTDAESQEPLILTVNEVGDWFLSVGEDPESAIDRETVRRLASAVIRLDPGKRVLVAGDSNVDYGQIMQAMVVLQKSGAKKIGLMAEPPKQ